MIDFDREIYKRYIVYCFVRNFSVFREFDVIRATNGRPYLRGNVVFPKIITSV